VFNITGLIIAEHTKDGTVHKPKAVFTLRTTSDNSAGCLDARCRPTTFTCKLPCRAVCEQRRQINVFNYSDTGQHRTTSHDKSDVVRCRAQCEHRLSYKHDRRLATLKGGILNCTGGYTVRQNTQLLNGNSLSVQSKFQNVRLQSLHLHLLSTDISATMQAYYDAPKQDELLYDSRL